MRRLAYTYMMNLSFSEPVYEHRFQLRLKPHSDVYQTVEEATLRIEPEGHLNEGTDGFGNCVISGQIMEPHDHLRVEASGIVAVEYMELLEEDCHPMYRAETELTAWSEEMAELLPKSESFYERMMEISRRIYFELYYTPKSTSVATTAREAFAMKKGVCQDFSHIMLAAVRHLGYPARYVAGMMGGEGESHAWIEVYNDGKWYGFDPTNNRPVNNQYIVIARGRDYRDCALDKGIFEAFNYSEQQMEVHLSVRIVE